MTRILRVNPLDPEAEKIRIAADVIKRGGLVAFPTETVYGLGANALDANAVRKIFKAKNRPVDNPLIVHISAAKDLERIGNNIPERILKLAEEIWPGPLTLLLNKRDNVPKEVSGKTSKVAIRIPAHPIALALIEIAGVPIAAPSANTATKPSPTSAKHVMSDLAGKIDLVLDGGDTFFGVESTIIDVTTNPYLLLRPGAYSLEDLRKRFGRIKVPRAIKEAKESDVAYVPGMKYRHYAPTKPIYMTTRSTLLKSPNLFHNPKVGIICSKELAEKFDDGHRARAKVIVLGSEKNLYEIAKNLFSSFRRLDLLDVDYGVIEMFQEKGIGLAIMNRIRKATMNKSFDSSG